MPLFNLWLFRSMVYGSVISQIIILMYVFLILNEETKPFYLFTALLLLITLVSSFIVNRGIIQMIHYIMLLLTLIIFVDFFYKIIKKNDIKIFNRVLLFLLLLISVIYLYYLTVYNQNSYLTTVKDLISLKPIENILLSVPSVIKKNILIFIVIALLYLGINIYKRKMITVRSKVIINNILLSIFVLLFACGIIINKYNTKPFILTESGIDFKNTFDWIKNKSSKESYFIIPPYFHYWTGANRRCFYDVNNVNGANYNKNYIMPVINNFKELYGIDISNLTENEIKKLRPPVKDDFAWSQKSLAQIYDSLTEEKIRSLKEKYGITHIVTRSNLKYNYNVVFFNKTYRIYEL